MNIELCKKVRFTVSFQQTYPHSNSWNNKISFAYHRGNYRTFILQSLVTRRIFPHISTIICYANQHELPTIKKKLTYLFTNFKKVINFALNKPMRVRVWWNCLKLNHLYISTSRLFFRNNVCICCVTYIFCWWINPLNRITHVQMYITISCVNMQQIFISYITVN